MTMSMSVLYTRSGAFAQKAAYQRNLVESWIITYGGIFLVILGFRIASLYSEPMAVYQSDDTIEITKEMPPMPPIARDPIVPATGSRHSQVQMPSIPVPRPDEEFIDEDSPLPTSSESSRFGAADSGGVSDADEEGAWSNGSEPWPEPFVFQPVDKEPDFVYRAPVEYPRLARQAGLAGTVWVRALVDESGNVINSILHRSSGVASLDEVAVATAHKNRFSPGIQNRRPVKVWVSYPVVFSLSD